MIFAIDQAITAINTARLIPPDPDDPEQDPTTRDRSHDLAGAAALLLLAKLPHAADNYDKLSPAEQDALKARTGLGRLDINDLCPFNPAGFPVMRWLADHDQMSRSTRSITNGLLGILAQENIQEDADDVADPAVARAYYLKSFLFSSVGSSEHIASPRLWSDGIDDDVFGNFERQGLQRYFDRVMAGAQGHLIRTLHAETLARSNPDKMRALLISEGSRPGGFYDALLLIDLENEGLIPQHDTPADRAYWQKVYDDLTPEMKRLHGPKLLPRIAITKAETAKAQVKRGK